MPAELRYLAPAPRPDELPARLPSPFDPGPPHPLARRAAEEVMGELAARLGRELGLDVPGGGKMFAVLVVADRHGRAGYLRAFSGMVGGGWELAGFAPPVFDAPAREAVWPAGEHELAELAARIDELARHPDRVAWHELVARQEAELAELRTCHRERRAARRAARAELADRADASAELHALDQASRADGAERRRLEAIQLAARRQLEPRAAALAAELAALAQQRAERSRELLRAIRASYVLASARGERRAMDELFAPGEPPGGAGDCAAPKLLAAAYRDGLVPLALAEWWWGAPPATGGRRQGHFYPACRGKCGPILAHMLDGLDAEPAPVFGAAPVAADEPRTVYEDPWLVVVAKPEGLLSVPGRGEGMGDSVLARLRARYPGATGPLIAHRLDLDTSGLLIAAKDSPTHAALQRLFARREVVKRYVAWVDGSPARDAGVIELALRVDVDDRPRQIHDPVHGKPAITEWRVLERAGGRTRVALFPRTGRAHQLRVHAADARGLGAAIAGDRLYGTPGPRLLLHAEALAFVHPHTHERICIELAAPF